MSHNLAYVFLFLITIALASLAFFFRGKRENNGTQDAKTGSPPARSMMDSLSLPYDGQGSSVRTGSVASEGAEAQAGEELRQAEPEANRAGFTGDEASMAVQRKLRIETELRTALEREEFSLDFQPQYCLRSGTLRGFEALLRWRNSELGAVSPPEFVPILEETRLIVPVGAWAIERACDAVARLLPQASTVSVSVNVSAVQIGEASFNRDVVKALRRSGLDAGRLELELSQSALPDSLELADDRLTQLRGLGVRLALDDVGTGFSSLDSLRTLPFDLIKIDRSFLQEVCDVQVRERLASLLRHMQALPFDVLAEGLESYDQLVFLQQHGCDFAQGYLLSHPLPEDRLLSGLHPDRDGGPTLLMP